MERTFGAKAFTLMATLSLSAVLASCGVDGEPEEIKVTPETQVSNIPGVDKAFEADSAVNDKYFQEALAELIPDRAVAEVEFNTLKTGMLESCEALSNSESVEESFTVFAASSESFSEVEKNQIWGAGVHIYCPQNTDIISQGS